jgi:hypothetical protein
MWAIRSEVVLFSKASYTANDTVRGVIGIDMNNVGLNADDIRRIS